MATSLYLLFDQSSLMMMLNIFQQNTFVTAQGKLCTVS